LGLVRENELFKIIQTVICYLDHEFLFFLHKWSIEFDSHLMLIVLNFRLQRVQQHFT